MIDELIEMGRDKSSLRQGANKYASRDIFWVDPSVRVHVAGRNAHKHEKAYIENSCTHIYLFEGKTENFVLGTVIQRQCERMQIPRAGGCW